MTHIRLRQRERCTQIEIQRDRRRERRADTERQLGEKEEIKEQKHLSNDIQKREKEIHVFSKAFQLYLDTLARLSI